MVEDDIDPWDSVAVEWAVATRMKPHRDLVIVPDVRADRAEPLEKDGTITKLGIDATRRKDDRSDWRRRGRPRARANEPANCCVRSGSIEANRSPSSLMGRQVMWHQSRRTTHASDELLFGLTLVLPAFGCSRSLRMPRSRSAFRRR